MPEVHERKGEVVEHIGGGERVVELDGVEQDRPPPEQNDVAQVKVAMAVPNMAAGAACEQEGRRAVEGGAHGGGKRPGAGSREDVRRLKELGQSLVHDAAEGVGGGDAIADRRSAVGRDDQAGDLGDERRCDLAAVGDEVEGQVLVEALHVDGPLDDGAVAAEVERAIFAGDRARPR